MRRFRTLLVLAAAFLCVALAGCSGGEGAKPTATVAAQTPTPKTTPAAPGTPPPVVRAAPEITVPPGFTVTVYASGLNRPGAMAFGPDGRLYVAQGPKVVSIAAGDTAFRAFLNGLDTPLGLQWIGKRLFISERGKVEVIDTAQGRPALETLIDGLPFDRHQQNNLVLGPDGRLYLGSGSTCDACQEADPRSATILSFKPDGSELRVVATGLRNPFGLAFQPGTGRLYVTVNGRDDLGTDENPEPADILVRIEDGAFYGWPGCWPSAQEGVLKGDCAGVTPPAAYLAPHGAATGLAFYTGESFPQEFQGNVFIAQWGTFGPSEHGHNLVRVKLGADGRAASPADVSVFATGFEHPLGVIVDSLGALLVSDYGADVIYRIQAEGKP